MSKVYEFEDSGCCLNCSDSHPGCLCFDCQCRKCEYYNPEGYCEIAKEWASDNYYSMAKHLQITFSANEYGLTIIQVKTTGPVVKENYAKLKVFLRDHFRYSDEKKCYQTYSENWQFVRKLRNEAKKAGFTPVEILSFGKVRINLEDEKV